MRAEPGTQLQGWSDTHVQTDANGVENCGEKNSQPGSYQHEPDSPMTSSMRAQQGSYRKPVKTEKKVEILPVASLPPPEANGEKVAFKPDSNKDSEQVEGKLENQAVTSIPPHKADGEHVAIRPASDKNSEQVEDKLENQAVSCLPPHKANGEQVAIRPASGNISTAPTTVSKPVSDQALAEVFKINKLSL